VHSVLPSRRAPNVTPRDSHSTVISMTITSVTTLYLRSSEPAARCNEERGDASGHQDPPCPAHAPHKAAAASLQRAYPTRRIRRHAADAARHITTRWEEKDHIPCSALYCMATWARQGYVNSSVVVSRECTRLKGSTDPTYGVRMRTGDRAASLLLPRDYCGYAMEVWLVTSSVCVQAVGP
jgi:hypothetical protein